MRGTALVVLVLAMDQWAGAAADPASPVASAAMTPMFLGVAAVGLVALGLWHRGTTRGPGIETAARARA